MFNKKEWSRLYTLKNKEKLTNYQKSYYIKNKEKITERVKLWRKKTFIPKIGNKGWFKTGIPETKNIHWKGDDVGYVALHIWVRKWKGMPNRCEICDNITAKRFQWANVDHRYRRVLEDYIRMCVSCHRKYDYEHNGYAPKGRKLSTS